MLVTRCVLHLALRVIIEKASIMFKIAPGNFSQPLGHLSINLLLVMFIHNLAFYVPSRTLRACYSVRPVLQFFNFQRYIVFPVFL